ncbi:MAG: hypothetical protein U9O55_00355 [Patescibacteria group bacterium]|nr:hypothetical protein [Patescibacteria group bacterium]
MDNLQQNNKKTFLYSLTAKIILAIIIFAGLAIIIGTLFIINSRQKISTFCEGLMSVEKCAKELKEPFSSLLMQSKLKNDVFLYKNNKKIIFFTDINVCANLKISSITQKNNKTTIQLFERGNPCDGGYTLKKIEIKVKEPIQKNTLEIYKEIEFLKGNFQNFQIYPGSKFEKKSKETVKDDKIIYSNKKYGFQLTLTSNFKNYKIKTTNSNTLIDNVIEFSTPTNFLNSYNFGYSQLFNISVYDIKKWDKDVKFCKEDYPGKCDWIDHEIARNYEYVFSHGVINGDCMEDQKEAFNDIQKIIKTFKFTD